MAFLKTLRGRDPHALIVVLGEHLPFLGMNHANYTDSGLLAENRAEFTDEMFRTLVATPLIVIDGKQGPPETWRHATLPSARTDSRSAGRQP